MKPDFKNIDIKAAAPAGKLCGCKAKKAGADEIWKTPEHIEVKPVYTKDLEGEDKKHVGQYVQNMIQEALDNVNAPLLASSSK